MKQRLKKIGRAVLVLAAAAAVITGVSVWVFCWKIDRSFRCVEVPKDPARWQVIRDIDSDGKKSTRFDLYLPQPPRSAATLSDIPCECISDADMWRRS